jgi:hypothetical protein
MKKDSSIAEKYIKLNEEAIKRYNTAMTRIFILSDDEIFSEDNILHEDPRKKNDLLKVLIQQDQLGIGWAVAWHDELDHDTLENPDVALDFAIFDDGKAISFFREYREWTRRFTAVFHTPDNHNLIEEQIEQHHNILAQCWMANKKLKENLHDVLNIKIVKERISRSTSKLREKFPAILGEKDQHDEFDTVNGNRVDFPIELTDIKEIEKMVDLLISIRKKSRLWRNNSLQMYEDKCHKARPHGSAYVSSIMQHHTIITVNVDEVDGISAEASIFG